MGHDAHIAVTCADCRFFTHGYPDAQSDRRLRGWGYCRRPGGGEIPSATALAELRAAVTGDDRHALRRNRCGLYRSEPEDGCEFFAEAIGAPAGAAGGKR